MKKFILYAHGGSKNHGCEALVRSTCDLLKIPKEQVALISANPEEDVRYGVDAKCRIIKRGQTVPIKKRSWNFLKAYFCVKVLKNYKLMDAYCTMAAADVTSKDIAISIGGDSYCYASDVPDLVKDHELWAAGGLKSVYWGCSIEPELLDDPVIANDIRRFDLITARESISYEALKKVNSNTVLTIDSAFFLKAKATEMPENFIVGNTVGINVSPLSMGCGKTKEIVLENYKRLIQYLIEQTDANVCLIPHVIKKHDDDREPLSLLFSLFEETNRVCMLEDCGAEELKWVISQCRFFVGARTHATIAAYSTCVPTLVVGYSIKSRGIARDLFGTEKQYVLAAQDMCNADDLLQSFLFIMQNEKKIKEHLIEVMPTYLQQTDRALQALAKLG